MFKAFAARRARNRSARQSVGDLDADRSDLPLSRVALIDEQLRWISLDGVVLDLASGEADPAASSPRLHPRDARVAAEIAAGAPVRETLTTVDGRHVEINAVPVRHGEREVVVGIARSVRTDAPAAEARS
jgi:hypothetical protein